MSATDSLPRSARPSRRVAASGAWEAPTCPLRALELRIALFEEGGDAFPEVLVCVAAVWS